MFDGSLFIGIPLREIEIDQLKILPTPLLAAFIKDQPSDYLQKIESDGISYLGKFIEVPYNVSNIQSLEQNILSLLRKLLPDFSSEDNPLLLIAL